MNRILVIRAGAVGDFVVTLPVLDALRKRWPGAQIEVVGHPRIAGLALEAGIVDRVSRFEDPVWSALFVEQGALPSGLARVLAGQDAVISFTPDANGVMGRRLREACAGPVVVHPPKPSSVHVTGHLLGALASFGIPSAPRPARLGLPAGRCRRGAAHVASLGLDVRRLAAVHAGSGGEHKCWPWERFEALVRALVDNLGCDVILTAGPADERLLPRMRALEAARVRVVAGMDLLDLAGVLVHARRYVGNDSGITHLAAALEVSTVAIFGPTDPAVWAPLGRHVSVVYNPCLAAVEPEAVLRACRAQSAPRPS